VVHGALRSLGLELVQDTSQLGDLGIFELELVSQEPKWASDAEMSKITVVVVVPSEDLSQVRDFLVVSPPAASAPSSTVIFARLEAGRRTRRTFTRTATMPMGVFPPPHHSRIHICFSLLAEAFAPSGFALPSTPAEPKEARGHYATRRS
jgi:hypothetical protein